MAERDASNDDVRSVWDSLAGWWDEQMEAGNTWQRSLIAPAVERLLAVRPGERVLELACGNGEFARKMAELGARVLATDFSDAMLERAQGRGGAIEYRRLDATDADAIRALEPDGPFDAAVSNMAIMDMTEIEPMAEGLAAVVRPGGRLVISTLHPAFNSGSVVFVTEMTQDADGRMAREHSIKRSTYIESTTHRGTAMEDQPTTQWYFHRPIEAILQPFFDHGWVVDGLAEPVLGRSDSTPFAQIPGVLVVRFARP
jgi:ubiquinone/menaquinone biosynthesis C-methylase UbiE